MLFDWLKNDVAEFDKAPEYLDVGTSWFDATQLGLVRRIRLSFAGWRDGRRNLVVVSDGVAKSAYLDSLRASFLAEIEALAQKRRKFGIAAPALVTGHVKGHHSHGLEVFQSLIYGRSFLRKFFHLSTRSCR